MASRNAVAVKQDEAGSRRRERMRAILIEASLRLFAQKGVDATTIDEIVTVAGVAKGTFYNYFTDRADIARAVGGNIRQELNMAVDALNAGIDDPAERIRRGVCLFMASVAGNPDKATMLSRLYDSGLSITGFGNAHLLGDIRDGIAKGRIDVPSEEAALHHVVGLGTAAMRHLLDTGAGPEVLRGEGYARDISLVLLRGLGVPPAEVERIVARPCDLTNLTVWS
jgi:AcrR family transcriptional regulator